MKRYKIWIVEYHREGDTSQKYIKNMQAKSREDLEKQAKRDDIIIDKAVLKILEVRKK